MKPIFILIFAVLIFSMGESQTVAEHYKTENFDVAIFPKEYQLHKYENRFTPTKEEITQAENALNKQFRKFKISKWNLAGGPNILNNLNKYRRQYFGIIDENGNRILYINAFWSDEDGFDYWLDKEIFVNDGGSYFWNIKYFINENLLSDLMINGGA
jgi:hypothetical protein